MQKRKYPGSLGLGRGVCSPPRFARWCALASAPLLGGQDKPAPPAPPGRNPVAGLREPSSAGSACFPPLPRKCRIGKNIPQSFSIFFTLLCLFFAMPYASRRYFHLTPLPPSPPRGEGGKITPQKKKPIFMLTAQG